MQYSAANCVTLSRFFFAAGVLLARPGSGFFWAMYAFGAGSDVLDGLLVRLLHQSTPFGAQLDSWADAAFFGAVLISFFRGGGIPVWGWAIAALAACVRLSAYAVGAIRFHAFAALHTWGNKFSGLLLAALPVSGSLLGTGPAAAITGAIACLSALEELVLLCQMRTLNRDVKGIFAQSMARR